MREIDCGRLPSRPLHDPRRILAGDQRKALIAPGSANPFGPSTRVNSPVSGSQVTRRGTKGRSGRRG